MTSVLTIRDLTEEEKTVLLSLHETEPCDVSAITERAVLPLERVQELLHRLVAKGLITESSFEGDLTAN